MRARVTAAIGVLATLVLIAWPAAAATRAVRVGSFYFEDATRGDSQVVVQQGDRITFTFEGKTQHTASVDGLFTSGTKSPGQRYTTPPLTRVGTFTLYCRVHGAPRHGTALVIRRRATPAPNPTRTRTSPAPSPAPTKSSPAASPSRTAVPSPTPASRTPVPTRSRTPSPTAGTVTSATPLDSPSVDASAVDVPPLDSAEPEAAHRDLLLPAVLLLFVLAGGGAIALGRRRRRRR